VCVRGAREQMLDAGVARFALSACRVAMSWRERLARTYSLPGVGEDKSLEDISAQDTRIHPGYGLRLEARNVLNSEGKE